MESIKPKLDRIFSKLDVDLILIKNNEVRDPNFLYLTGFTSGIYEGDVLIATKGTAYLLTSQLEYETAMSQKKIGLKVLNVRSSRKRYVNALSKFLKGKKVGINGSFITYSSFTAFEAFKPRAMVDVSKALEEARLIKDDSEVQNIRKAISITKLAIIEAKKYLKEGVTESTFAAQIDYIMKSLGATGLAFDTIAAFGKNAALPHHMPDETKLKAGDFVLIDTGAKYNNYCADISRTFIFGKAKQKDASRMEDMLKVVKEAQLKAIKAIKPGVSGAEVSEMVTSYINSYGNKKYSGKFIHALGHSVGIEVHDATIFSKSPKVKIKKGMVMAIEPGVYINGFGGVRIEDDILVTEDGAIVL